MPRSKTMDKRNSQRPLVTACLLSLGLAGCSSGGLSTSPYPYQVGKTNVIGASDTGSAGSVDGSAGSRNATGSPSSTLVGVAPVATYTTPTDAAACIDVQGTCVKPQKDCGTDGTADVILGPNGEVLSTICYPNRDYKVVVLGDAPVSSPPLGNNSVIVLDNKDDGVDVQGNLKITGNNVIVWGYGPDTSVIGGNLDIDKNNAIVRGVRVNGDVSITKNNAALIDCVIDGNLTITGNNVSLALCQIWGTVTIEGKNTVLVSNLVLGDQVISGDNLRCNDNHRFADANTDGVFQDAEVTGPVTCESRGQAVTDTTNLTPKKP